MEISPYGGWKNVIKLSNEFVELFVTLEVGPRIVRYSFLNDLNVFKEVPDQLGSQGEDEWCLRGGHRLWVAPEDDGTYTLDNVPVEYEKLSKYSVIVRNAPEKLNGWQKEMEIKLDKETPRVTVRHRIRNISDRESKPISAWALTVMAPGGHAIVATPPPGPHVTYLLPNRKFIFWPYAEPNDPRMAYGPANFQVWQDAQRGPFKIGALSQQKWVAYQNGNTVFAKSIPYESGVHYPDMGVNLEIFTNQEILEVETLSPLRRLQPGEVIEHIEKWVLLRHDEVIDTHTNLNSLIEPKLGV